ncbi:MAG: hypothetical protein IKN65_04000 [Clostridia bacterium]|nr:hypothetical protein [Clostridia bacterium]
MGKNEKKVQKRKNEVKKTGKGKTIALMIIILILVLVLGVLAGVMFFGKGDTIINRIQENNSNNSTDNTVDKDTNKEGYSNEELEKMALDYYEAKTGYRPGSVASKTNEDGTVSIQLYDDFEDHISTSDWYSVDSKTAVGTNDMGEKIDLKVKPSRDKSVENKSSNNTTTSNNNNKNTENVNNDSYEETIWYTCDAFKIKLPKSWKNKYTVDIGDVGGEGGESYNFRTKSDDEYLFSIEVRNKAVEGQTPYKLLGIATNEKHETIYVYMIERQDAPAKAEPYTSMMKDFEDNKDDIYIKHVVFSVNNGDNAKRTIYAKNFTTIKYGSMYRYYIYYIDENDTFCILNYENNITVEKIVDYTKKLVYNENDNKIHAYPIGDSFMNNFRSERNIEEVVYENKM